MVAMTRRTYTAVCERSGDRWPIEVPAAPGVSTQARRLAGAEAMARDAISLMLEEDSFDLVVAHLPAELATEVDAAREPRQTADRYQCEATSAARAVAGKLAQRHGLSIRGIGRILGLSHQRVHQLLSAPQPPSA